MAGDTIITVVGNLTDQPDLKFTQTGVALANFTVASTPRFFDRQSGEWKDGDTLFVRCTAWRQPAENVAGSLHKGQRVIAQGALRVRQFERADGSRGTSVEMNVDEVGPSLRYVEATVVRKPRGGVEAGGGQQPVGVSTAPSADGQPEGGSTDPWTRPAESSEAPPF